jgi:hypothetical protein
MIKERFVDPEELKKKVRSDTKIEDFVFNRIDRENPFNNLYQDRKTPAIG